MSSLNNVKARSATITLCDGVARELKFTLNALAEMEDRYGSVEAAFKAMEANSIKAVRFVIWTGLLHTEEGLTEQQVGNLIDMQCMDTIMNDLQAALSSDMPEPDASGATLPNA